MASVQSLREYQLIYWFSCKSKSVLKNISIFFQKDILFYFLMWLVELENIYVAHIIFLLETADQRSDRKPKCLWPSA